MHKSFRSSASIVYPPFGFVANSGQFMRLIPPSPHQTGGAVFPHPAFPTTLAAQHAPASFPGSRQCVAPIYPVIRGVEPLSRLLLGFAAEAFQKTCQCRRVNAIALCSTAFLYFSPHFRSGSSMLQAADLASFKPCRRQGPFAPRELPRLAARMNPSDFRSRPPPGYWFPSHVTGAQIPPTACRISQVPD